MSKSSVTILLMISELLCVVGIFIFLVIVEILSRKKKLHSEVPRKIIHILVGSFIAFWPFIMPLRNVQLLSLALLLVVILSKFFHIFKSIHAVRRFTIGELLFPVGIGLAALLTHSKWIFAAAILHMSLADGLAALIGVHFVKKPGHYSILGQTKTIVGSSVFLITSLAITAWVVLASSAGFSVAAWPVIVVLPLVSTTLENFSPYGIDNLLIPLLVIGVLGSLQFIY